MFLVFSVFYVSVYPVNLSLTVDIVLYCRIVYRSNKRSVDLCPLDVVDDNSTVTLSISTDSTTPIEVNIRVLVKGRVIDWKPITDTKYVDDIFR